MRNAIDEPDRQVHQRHRQQLVVEGRQTALAEPRVERDVRRPIDDTEEDAPELGPWRGRRIGEQQVHAEEDGDRDLVVDEEIGADQP